MDIISQVAACLGKLRDVRDRETGSAKRSPLESAWAFVRSQLLVARSNKDLPRELVDTLSPLLSRALPPSGASPGALSKFLDECVADLCRFQGALDARLRIRGEFETRLRAAAEQARQELRRENAIVLARTKEEAAVAAAAKAREDVRQQVDLERASMEDDLRAEVEAAHQREVEALKVQHGREMTELRNAMSSSTRVSQAMLSTSLGSVGSPKVGDGASSSVGGPSVLELQEELRTLEEELRRERQTFDEERTRLHQELALAQKRAMRVEADHVRAANSAQRNALAASTKSVSRRLELTDRSTTHSPITSGPRRLTMSTPISLASKGSPGGGPGTGPVSVWTPDRTAGPSTSRSTKSPSPSRRMLSLGGGHGDAKSAVLASLADSCSSPLLTDVLSQLGSCLARLKDVDRSSKGIAKKAALESVWSFIQGEVFKTRQLNDLDAEVIDRLDGVLSRSVPSGRGTTDAALVFFLESVIAELSRAHGTLEAKLERNTQLHRARAKVIELWPSSVARPAPAIPPEHSAALEGELVDTIRKEYEDLLKRSRSQYARDVEGLTLMLEDERESHDRVVRVTEARVRALCRREKEEALARLRDDLHEEKAAATEVAREELERKIARLQARVVAAESPSSRYAHTLPPEVNPHFANLGPRAGSAAARFRDSARPSSGFGSSSERFKPVHGQVMEWYEKEPTE